MNLYRQKSQTVETVQFDPDVHPWPEEVHALKDETDNTVYGYIATADGRESVRSGDWIVRGASGTLHVCGATVFESLYEPVDAMLDAPTYDKIYQNVMARIQADLRKQIGGNV